MSRRKKNPIDRRSARLAARTRTRLTESLRSAKTTTTVSGDCDPFTGILPYVHTPLDTNLGQIRLFKVRRDTHGIIHCDISVFDVDIDARPSYLALSYTWGPRTPAQKIMIDGRYLEIRQNLFDFFEVYCNEPQSEYIWIDQISIDQSNTLERNHQVALMATIYTKALYVIVWLGNSPQYASAASTINAAIEECEDDLSKLPRPGGWLESIDSILRSPYFQRVWIVQEVVLARSVKILVHGNSWISFDSLRGMLSSYRRITHDRSSLDIKVLVVLGQSGSYYPLLAALFIFNFKDCEDPRDKVYGLLALVKNEERIAVDYTKSVSEVFIAVVKKTVSQNLEGATRKHAAKILVDLGRHMGLEEGGTSYLNFMAGFSRNFETPITAVGIESCYLEGPNGRPSDLTKPAPFEQWWFEANGKKHRYNFGVRPRGRG